MKENKEKSEVGTEDEISENAESTVSAEESTANPIEMEETAVGPKNGKGGNKKLRNAIIRMAAALVAAVILLAITRFAPITLLKGPKETEAIQNSKVGDFVARDIYCILGFYADDKSKSGETTGRYAAVPMNGELVSVHFTDRYLESANAVCDNTYGLINGKVAALDKYVVVEGTVEKMGEDASSLMYDWFGINKDQLVQMKMIADTDDYSEYLSDYVLEVDTVNSYSETLVYITGIIASLLMLYSLVEIILMSIGFYMPKPIKEHCAECNDVGNDIAEGNSDVENVNNDDVAEIPDQQKTEIDKSEKDEPEDME